MIYFFMSWITKKIMSKSKKRILHRNKDYNPLSCSRKEAISFVTNSIKTKHFDKEAKNMLSLFGISGEELSEAGLSWEELKVIAAFINC